MSAGTFVNVLEAVPETPAKFCAVTETVTGPSGTPVNGESRNWWTLPVPVRSRADVKGGAVDSGGWSQVIVSVAGDSTPSPVTVPEMSIEKTSRFAPFAGDVICRTGGFGGGGGASPSNSRSSMDS